MRTTWTARHVSFLLTVGLLAVTISPALAQRGGTTAGGGGATTGGAATNGSVGSTGRSPSVNNYPGSSSNPSSPNVWPGSRPVFLSGRVLMDDGVKPNSDIRIERVCGGIARLEGHTDSKGQFSFQVGQNAMVDTDASDGMSGNNGRPGSGGFGNSGSGTFGNTNSSGGNGLWGCELRAAYPGYRSDLLELGTHRSSDDPEVGTIILHRLGGAGGGSAGTISMTTELAPKHAQKEYDKGAQLALKGKLEDAEKHFAAATDEYPKYAIAWFALGQVQQREGNPEAARKSYQAAVAADAKYASPYDQLALLSAQRQEWEASAKFSKEAIALDAVDYPTSLWYNAVANYQLKKPDEAEKSIRQLLRMDTAHRYPEADNLCAQLLLNKGDYVEAATHLRTYLKVAPNANGAAAAKQQLAKLEEQAKAAPPK